MLKVGRCCARLVSHSLETVSLHDLGDTLQIRWTTGSHDCANFAEKVRAEHTGSDRHKKPYWIGAAIDELMHGPAGNKESLAGCERVFATFDNERASTGQTIDGLIVGHVPVRCWHPRTGRYCRFKQRKRAGSLAPFQDIPNLDCADFYNFFWG